MQAMLFSAGLGTRLRPITDKIPKALIPVAGKPLIEHQILKLRKVGVDFIVVNVHHFAEQIVDFLQSKNNFDIDIRISDESDMLLDTGGGLLKAAKFFNKNEAILAHNVDILTNLDLTALYRQHQQQNATGTLVASKRDTQRYLLFDNEMWLRGWTNISTGELRPKGINYTDFEQLAFAGIQIFNPDIFNLMNNFPPKFSIMDVYLQNTETNNFRAYCPQNFKILDIGKHETLKIAENFFINNLQD
jgi:NDP-sugar pyrophosphorylase family protein